MNAVRTGPAGGRRRAAARGWAVAVLASVAVHAAALALLAWSVAPENPPAQGSGEARLDLAVYEVERRAAREAVPEAAEAALGDAAGTRTGATSDPVGGVIPQSRASSEPLQAAALDAIPAAGTPLTAQEARVDSVPAVLAGPDPVRADAPPAEVAVEVPAEVAVGADRRDAVPLAGVAIAAPLASVRASVEPASAVVPPGSPMEAVAAATTPLAAGDPSSERVVTAAPSGADATPADARPVTVTAAAPEVSPVLPRPPAGIRAASARPQFVAATPSPGNPRPAEPRQITAAPARPAAIAPIAAVASAPSPDPVRFASARPVAAMQGEATGARAAALPTDRLAAASPELTPPSARATATLAWSGEGQIDPVSLAAIAAFAEAGDPGDAAGEVRDGIGQILAAVPCARLQTRFDPETGTLELAGHVPEDALRAPVMAALQQAVGPAIPLRSDLLILPRPQCGALAGLAAMGLPQSDEQETDPKIVGEGLHARIYRFADGQDVRFAVGAAEYPAYFYVDYFDADGKVIHLRPNDVVPLTRIAPGEAVEVGTAGPSGERLRLTVAPPFGQEIAAAFSASAPLFDGPRPTVEDADEYLSDVRAAIADRRAADPEFKGEWVYFFIETRPK